MGLNNLGLGFLFEAKDLASGVMGDIKGNLGELGEKGREIAKGLGESFEQFASGLGIAAIGLEGLAKLGEKAELAEHFGDAIKLAGNKVEAAEFSMESMKGIVNELGNEFGIMPIAMADALSTAIEQGARKAATAQALLTASTQLATASHTDLKGNVSALGQVMRAFNVDLAQSVAVSDQLYVASKHVEGGVQGMTSMLEVLGPTAHQAHMTTVELMASIAQMAAAGIGGRHGMMGLREVIGSMIEPTAAAKAEAVRLGVAFDRNTIQSEGLPALLAKITESQNFNAQSMEKLFGSTSAATVAMGLMRDGGAQLKTMMDKVRNSTGAAAEAAERMITESQRFDSVRASLDTMIGEALVPMKEAFFKLGTSMLSVFTEGNPAIVHFLTLLTYGASILAVVLGAGLMISAAWPIITLALGAMAAGAWEAAVAMAAALWPVVLIAAAVGLAIWGLKVAFDNNFGGIADTVNKVWGNIKLVFTALVELFSGGGFTEDTWQKLEKHSGIRDFAISVFGWVSRIENFFTHIGTSFEAGMSTMRPVFDDIGIAIDMLLDAFGMLSGPEGVGGAANAFDSFGIAGDALGVILTDVFQTIMAVVQLAIGVIHVGVAAIVAVVDSVRSIFSGLIDFFYGFFEFFAELVQGHWGKAWHGMKMMVFGVIDAIIGVVASLLGFVGGAIDAIAGMFGTKLHLQKDMQNFKDDMHNEGAKAWGIADGTGLRTIHNTSDSGLGGLAVGGGPAAPLSSSSEGQFSSPGDEPGVAAPANVSPWGGIPGVAGFASMPIASASGAAVEPPDFAGMTSHLEHIAKNTEAGNTVNVTLMMDSEVIGKAVSKAKANDATRSFTPAPVPG